MIDFLKDNNFKIVIVLFSYPLSSALFALNIHICLNWSRQCFPFFSTPYTYFTEAGTVSAVSLNTIKSPCFSQHQFLHWSRQSTPCFSQHHSRLVLRFNTIQFLQPSVLQRPCWCTCSLTELRVEMQLWSNLTEVYNKNLNNRSQKQMHKASTQLPISMLMKTERMGSNSG